jgi:hypothetical protein
MIQDEVSDGGHGSRRKDLQTEDVVLDVVGRALGDELCMSAGFFGRTS